MRRSGPAHGSRRPDSSSLGMNPSTRPVASRGPVRARLAARRQDDERRRPVDRQLPGDVEALDVGQADVEQDEIRSERPGGREARGAVVGLADDDEAVGLEDGARLDAEPGMVIDDEDGVHARDRGMARAPSSYRVSPDVRATPARGVVRPDPESHSGLTLLRAASRVSESADERTFTPSCDRHPRHGLGSRRRGDRYERRQAGERGSAAPRDRPDLPLWRAGDLGPRAGQPDRPADDRWSGSPGSSGPLDHSGSPSSARSRLALEDTSTVLLARACPRLSERPAGDRASTGSRSRSWRSGPPA